MLLCLLSGSDTDIFGFVYVNMFYDLEKQYYDTFTMLLHVTSYFQKQFPQFSLRCNNCTFIMSKRIMEYHEHCQAQSEGRVKELAQ